MNAIIQFIVGLFTGAAGPAVGGVVSGVTQVASVAAIVTPIGLALINHKDAVFITVTYGQLAFWGSLAAAQVFIAIRLVHRAPPPQ